MAQALTAPARATPAPGANYIRPSSRLAARKNSVVKAVGRYENEFTEDPGYAVALLNEHLPQ